MQDAAIERYVYDDMRNGMASLDGGNVVLDFVDSDGPGGSGSMALSKHYLWGEQVDELLAQEDVTKNVTAADRVLWPIVDHLGTVPDLRRVFARDIPRSFAQDIPRMLCVTRLPVP